MPHSTPAVPARCREGRIDTLPAEGGVFGRGKKRKVNMNPIQMSMNLAPQSPASKKYLTAYALARSSLYWLQALVEKLSGMDDDAAPPEGAWLPLPKVQELWVYIDLVSRTFRCVDDAPEELSETCAAELDLAEAARLQDGEEGAAIRPMLTATTYSALAHLNVLAVLMPQVAEEPPCSANAAKLALTCEFVSKLFQNLDDHVATFLQCEKGMPPWDFHHLAVCAAVAQDMLRSLDESDWDPDGPVPAFVTAKLNTWLQDPRFRGWDREEIDALVGDAVRAVEGAVLVEDAGVLAPAGAVLH